MRLVFAEGEQLDLYHGEYITECSPTAAVHDGADEDFLTDGDYLALYYEGKLYCKATLDGVSINADAVLPAEAFALVPMGEESALAEEDESLNPVDPVLNQVVDDPQLIKIESSGVPTTEDIRQRRLELDKLLQTPPVDEEIARQKAMELAVLTLVSVEMEEYEAHRLRSIFGKQAKMRELDANLLRQSVRKITYGSKTVKVLLKNNQVLEECDDA